MVSVSYITSVKPKELMSSLKRKLSNTKKMKSNKIPKNNEIPNNEIPNNEISNNEIPINEISTCNTTETSICNTTEISTCNTTEISTCNTNEIIANEIIANEIIANEIIANEIIANKIIANEIIANEIITKDITEISSMLIIDNFFISSNNTNYYIRFPKEDSKKIYKFLRKNLPQNFLMKANVADTIIGSYNILDINVPIDEVKNYKNFLKILAGEYQTEVSTYEHLEVLCFVEKSEDYRLIEFLYSHIQSQINFQLSCDILDKKFNVLRQYDRLKNIALKIVVERFESLLLHFRCSVRKPKYNPFIIEYCKVPSYVILEILKYNDLIIESENSVVFCVMYWINYDRENRKIFFKDFIRYFCFGYMHNNYLITVFPQIFMSLGKDIAVYSFAYYSKVLKERFITNSAILLPQKRKLISRIMKFMCDYFIDQKFNDDLKNGKRIFSSPMFCHGYIFLFFLKFNEKAKMISGYLLCASFEKFDTVPINYNQRYFFNIPLFLKIYINDKIVFGEKIFLINNELGVGCNLIPIEFIENKCNLKYNNLLSISLNITFEI